MSQVFVLVFMKSAIPGGGVAVCRTSGRSGSGMSHPNELDCE
jgi:hypothetical protein